MNFISHSIYDERLRLVAMFFCWFYLLSWHMLALISLPLTLSSFYSHSFAILFGAVLRVSCKIKSYNSDLVETHTKNLFLWICFSTSTNSPHLTCYITCCQLLLSLYFLTRLTEVYIPAYHCQVIRNEWTGFQVGKRFKLLVSAEASRRAKKDGKKYCVSINNSFDCDYVLCANFSNCSHSHFVKARYT